MIIGVGVLNKYLHVFHQRLNPELRPQGSPNSPSICSLSHPPLKRPAPGFCSMHHPACPTALSWLSSCSAALLTHSHFITTQNLTVSLSPSHTARSSPILVSMGTLGSSLLLCLPLLRVRCSFLVSISDLFSKSPRSC